MRYPSKRTAAIAEQEALRKQAIDENDPELFAAAVAAIKSKEAEPDVYTCICCSEDFEDGPHLDLLVAAVIVYGADGLAVERYDYGIKDTRENRAGRRIKICADCMTEWQIPVGEYLEAR